MRSGDGGRYDVKSHGKERIRPEGCWPSFLVQMPWFKKVFPRPGKVVKRKREGSSQIIGESITLDPGARTMGGREEHSFMYWPSFIPQQDGVHVSCTYIVLRSVQHSTCVQTA